MVEISVTRGMLRVEVLGWHKLFAFKSSFAIPLALVVAARRDPEGASRWWKGWRLWGTSMPGVIAAGWYYKDGRHVFWDVSNARNAIAIDLVGKGYSRLMVEVADPDAAVALIQQSIGRQTPAGTPEQV